MGETPPSCPEQSLVGLYRHFKGAYYFVTGFVFDAAQDCWSVEYLSEQGMKYVRSVTNFFEGVQTPDGVVSRFARYEIPRFYPPDFNGVD